jgi:hypothetical protein
MGIFELVIAIVVVLAVVAAAWAFFRRQRTNRLHRRFGPDYEHTVTTIGDRRQGEAELANREKQAKSLQIRPLGREEVEHFSVDHPWAAQNYRAAQGITQKTKSQEASTEDLRQAMTYYRELFNELLGTKVQERLQWQSTTSSPS